MLKTSLRIDIGAILSLFQAKFCSEILASKSDLRIDFRAVLSLYQSIFKWEVKLLPEVPIYHFFEVVAVLEVQNTLFNLAVV
jgi:hypothetical protein